jgi:hypothetical protein
VALGRFVQRVTEAMKSKNREGEAMKWSTKNDERCVGPAAEWGRCDTCDVNGVLPSSTQSRAGFQNRTFPVEPLLFPSFLASFMIPLFCSSPDYHSNREFPFVFCVCRVCSLKKISGLALCGRCKERNCFGKTQMS